jgi:hypothetical protein
MDKDEIKNEHVSRHEIILTDKKNRKGVKILLIILGVLMLLCIAVGVLVWMEFSETNRRDNESYCIIIAGKLNLVKKLPGKNDAAIFELVKELPFGTEVSLYKDNIIHQDNKAYYTCNSYLLDFYNTCEKDYYLEVVSAYDLSNSPIRRNEFLNIFPLKESQQLPSILKHYIIEFLGYEYYFTQDANRIGSSIVKADFNLDGEEDYAVVLQESDAYNKIIILCYNPDVPKYYVAFSDYNYGLADIKLFNKGAAVFVRSETPVEAPNKGIMYQFQRSDKGGYSYSKFAIFYDPKSKLFKQYEQLPLSEIQVDEEADGEDYNEDAPEYEVLDE